MDSKAQQEQLQWTIDTIMLQRERAEQKLTEQLQLLQQSMQHLEEKTTQANQELDALKQELNQIQWSNLQQPPKVDQFVGALTDKIDHFDLKNDWLYPLGGIIILVMLVALFWAFRKPKQKPTSSVSQAQQVEVDEDEDEYDFLGSEEGIPAKLDLARAYLAMEDHEAAQEVLQDIITKGNEQQVQEAKALLAS